MTGNENRNRITPDSTTNCTTPPTDTHFEGQISVGYRRSIRYLDETRPDRRLKFCSSQIKGDREGPDLPRELLSELALQFVDNGVPATIRNAAKMPIEPEVPPVSILGWEVKPTEALLSNSSLKAT